MFHVVSYPLGSVLALSFGTLFDYVARPFFAFVSAVVSVSLSVSISVSLSIAVSVSFAVSGSAVCSSVCRSGSRSQTELAITRVDDFALPLLAALFIQLRNCCRSGNLQLATCSAQLATASIIIQIYKKTIKNKFLEHKSTKLISFQLKLHAGSG